SLQARASTTTLPARRPADHPLELAAPQPRSRSARRATPPIRCLGLDLGFRRVYPRAPRSLSTRHPAKRRRRRARARLSSACAAMATTGQEEDDVDHYEVLCLPSGEEGAALTIEQIEKAYRTQSRQRHPDKRPDDPNATADFQRLSSSYKLLRDESLRRQFDARLRGRREAAARVAAAGFKRRKAVSDLEERERAAAAGQPANPEELAKREMKQKAAGIERELKEFQNAKQAAASGAAATSAYGDKKGGASQDGAKTDKGKILKVSWDGSADSYTAAKLEELFQKFGKVEDIVIKTRKSRSKGSAIVVMGTKEAALLAIQNHFSLFPLNVAPVQESGGLPARSSQTNESRTSNIDGTGFNDLEASVFRKLQEAQKRKQCG
ncbi:unnamed protein product, partial [Urochloa humidicola]